MTLHNKLTRYIEQLEQELSDARINGEDYDVVRDMERELRALYDELDDDDG